MGVVMIYGIVRQSAKREGSDSIPAQEAGVTSFVSGRFPGAEIGRWFGKAAIHLPLVRSERS
jgi:hypothetical protein